MTTPTIELRHVDELVRYSKNSRTHSADQVAQIAASIEAFGMVGAIVVRDMLIAKGHGTLSAIESIYAKGGLIYPAPGKSAGADPYPSNKVPIIDCTGWTDEQFKAFVIADNQLALNAGYDMEVLGLEVCELDAAGFDLDILGFDQAELDALLGGADELPGDEEGDPPGDDEDDRVKITFKLTPEQAEQVRAAMGVADGLGEYVDAGNDHHDSNALARVCETFLTQNG